MGHAGYLFVLLRYTIPGVYHQQTHITPLYGRYRPDNAESFYILVHLALSPYSGGIYQKVLLSVLLKRRIYRIPGSARYRRYDNSVLSQQPVDKRRFPHVGLAYHGYLDSVLILVSCPFREAFDYSVEKISQIEHVGRGNRYRLAQSQLVKIVKVIRQPGSIHLVDGQYHFLARLHQHGCHLPVGSCYSVFPVRHEKYHVARVHGQLSLFPHLREDDILAVRFDTTRIYQSKMLAGPLGLSVYPVPGNTRSILHDGDPPAYHLIEKCGFSHVRPPYHGH